MHATIVEQHKTHHIPLKNTFEAQRTVVAADYTPILRVNAFSPTFHCFVQWEPETFVWPCISQHSMI